MTPLSKSHSSLSNRLRSRARPIVDAVRSLVARVRPAPEPRAERAKREAREFLQQRREAVSKAFESRMH